MSETVLKKIRADLRHYAVREGAALSFRFILRMALVTPGFQFVMARRLQEAAVAIPLVGRAIRRILWWSTCLQFGSEIAMGAEIAGGLYIPHPYGIVIGEARIGPNLALMQNVTIGRRSIDRPGDPTIETDVTIFAGAVIVGMINVGEGAVIAANSVVLKDVPARSTAAGIPARIFGS